MSDIERKQARRVRNIVRKVRSIRNKVKRELIHAQAKAVLACRKDAL